MRSRAYGSVTRSGATSSFGFFRTLSIVINDSHISDTDTGDETGRNSVVRSSSTSITCSSPSTGVASLRVSNSESSD
jgi:hypothetical protein